MSDDWATTKALEIIAARKLTTKIMHDDDGEPFGTITADNSVRLIAEVLREERERCAKIADNGMLVPPDGGSPTEDEIRVATGIAAAIRNPQSR